MHATRKKYFALSYTLGTCDSITIIIMQSDFTAAKKGRKRIVRKIFQNIYHFFYTLFTDIYTIGVTII